MGHGRVSRSAHIGTPQTLENPNTETRPSLRPPRGRSAAWMTLRPQNRSLRSAGQKNGVSGEAPETGRLRPADGLKRRESAFAQAMMTYVRLGKRLGTVSCVSSANPAQRLRQFLLHCPRPIAVLRMIHPCDRMHATKTSSTPKPITQSVFQIWRCRKTTNRIRFADCFVKRDRKCLMIHPP